MTVKFYFVSTGFSQASEKSTTNSYNNFNTTAYADGLIQALFDY